MINVSYDAVLITKVKVYSINTQRTKLGIKYSNFNMPFFNLHFLSDYMKMSEGKNPEKTTRNPWTDYRFAVGVHGNNRTKLLVSHRNKDYPLTLSGSLRPKNHHL